MTVRQLAKALSNIKESLQDKDVKIEYPNGLIAEFEIRFVKKDGLLLDLTEENIDYIILQ